MKLLLTCGIVLLYQILSVECVCNNEFDNGKYYISDNLRSWYQAKIECAKRNMDLVSICNFAENTQIREYIRSCSGSAVLYWLGLNDLGQEGDFKWQANGIWDYSNFETGQPNHLNGVEDCVAAKAVGSTFLWNDLYCENTLGYICKARSC